MNDLWETPQDLFDKLNKEFHFTIDAACLPETAKCERYWTPEEDALSQDWSGEKVWLNPPYSRGNIDKFMEKASRLEAEFVVCLVRFDPSAKWFQKFVAGRADQVRMLARRPKFVGAKSAYNFPCCVVVFDNQIMLDIEYPQYYIWDWK